MSFASKAGINGQHNHVLFPFGLHYMQDLTINTDKKIYESAEEDVYILFEYFGSK